jgi:peptidoglycan/xylan/chitin deacetylase (PgdA/CDA1 family)
MMDAHLRVLKARYNIIPLHQFIEWRAGRLGSSLPPYALVVTLDDGHRRNADLASVFRAHDVRATIFLCSAIVGTHRWYWWQAHLDHEEMVRLTRVSDGERLRRLAQAGFDEGLSYRERRALSKDEIDALRDVVDFQSHTRLHPVLPECEMERAVNEIVGSKAELEHNFGLRIYALAFPNGDYSDRDISLVREAGYRCALTLDGGYNSDRTDLFRLRRLRLSDDADENELVVKASGLWSFLERLFAARSYGYMRINVQRTSHIRDEQKPASGSPR